MLAAVIGYPALRYTGGVHLALITFAFGELARLVAANWDALTGGPMGMRVMYSPGSFFGIDLSSAKGLYWLAAGMLLVCLLVTVVIQRSRFGRGLVAVREDETLASFLGINVVGYKVAAYVISSMLAAMVGCAYAPIMNFISPDLLSAHETISLIGVLILGGIGTRRRPDHRHPRLLRHPRDAARRAPVSPGRAGRRDRARGAVHAARASAACCATASRAGSGALQ